MNPTLLNPAILTVVLGLIHSLRDERLIFRVIVANTSALHAAGLRQRCLNMLRLSLHLASVFSWRMAVMLHKLSQAPLTDMSIFVALTIAIKIFAGGMLVLAGTNARHPGWVVMLLIAALTVAGVA
jgi:hypothetical protein